jgi:protein-disulfide isomerase
MAEEEKTEKHTEHKPKTERTSELNVWRYTTIGLMVLVVALVLVFTLFPSQNGSTNTLSVTSQNQIANKTADFINKNLISSGTVTVDSVSESSGILNVTVDYQGRKIPVYVTNDGRYLVLSGVVDMSQSIPSSNETQQQQASYNPQKTDKPTTQLFVMAFCPYGIQAEDVMKPVVDLLGSKADIQVHFIATVSGTTPDTVQSLHGAEEVREDLRQVCIMKNYDQKTYWKYVMAIDANCSSQYSNSAAYDTCWKDAASKAGIDSSKIATCSNSTEGVALLKADADLSAANGVSGSPTLIINGATFSGSRTPDGYKTAICQAFTTEPSECSQTLSSNSSTTTTGGCGT